MRFTGNSDATLDDQFDSSALLSLGFDEVKLSDPEDFYTDEEEEFYSHKPKSSSSGRSKVTGY